MQQILKIWFYVRKAKELGCNYIATGHYAKTEYSEKYQRWVLKIKSWEKRSKLCTMEYTKRFNRTCIISTKRF